MTSAFSSPGVDSNDAASVGNELRQELVSCLDGGSAVGAHSLVVAVVEQDIGSSSALAHSFEAPLHFTQYAGGTNRSPVIAHHVPLHERKAEFARDAQHGGAACAVRRTHVEDGSAEDILERLTAAAKLLTDDAVRLPGEPGVRHGVVANQVTGGVDGPSDLRPLAHEAANHEERSADVVAREYVEELHGRGIVGTVVVGKGDLGWVVSGDEGAAEELRLRG